MQNINSTEDLEEAIRLLKIEQTEKKIILQEQFNHTYSSLNPENLILNTLKGSVPKNSFINSIFDSVIGLVAGFLSKKIIVGKSTNIFRNLVGTLFQTFITNLVIHHPGTLKFLGNYFQSINVSKSK